MSVRIAVPDGRFAQIQDDATRVYCQSLALQIATLAKGRNGQAKLVAGTVKVADKSVTAKTLVQLTVGAPGGTRGFLSAALIPGTGFTINSTAAETSTVNWSLEESP